MTLVRFEPMRELESFNDRFRRFFDDFPGFNLDESFSPKIDVSERENKIFVEADLPGVKKENLKLTLEDNILTLEGERKNESENKNGKYYRRERVYGNFKRSFTLPSEVDGNNVNAKFENGTLRVELNKVEPRKAEQRKIELK